MSGEGDACWLCARPLGRRTEWHHPVPKSRGGRETVPLHPICHRAIHASLTNAQLAKMAPNAEALLAVEEVGRFVRWVSGKPPDFHAPTRTRR
ncbi:MULTISPECIES: HNH endonuclease [unclassified Novosphingobium]|uniref:HNH endonuclease n=1 Tax=unclassified Novosphingobium TaxID=2644732 RepID=UPI001359070A|nr:MULTISPECIES: HNH endonuclease [unclassified Novosphingobium]